jgi:hypothetical protein
VFWKIFPEHFSSYFSEAQIISEIYFGILVLFPIEGDRAHLGRWTYACSATCYLAPRPPPLDELLGTRYEHYGRVDSDGFPHQAAAHTPFSRHLFHTEALLHHTQGQLDHVRMVTHERGFELVILCEDL